ncbi:14-dihydroxy-2-naphthoate octaprenyltransferase [Dehalogenimonas sp. WBC-2]|nr:14-dihydroxy-2-naphthoate octaprenyltransferase [Dehalogenimonas sp. WBC-2]
MRALTSPAPVPFTYWSQAARLKFLPQGVLPVIIGGVAAYTVGFFNPIHFIIAFMAAAAVQIGLTMFNDTLDFKYGTDRCTDRLKNPFSGGSGVLASGCIKPRQAMTVIIGLYLVAFIAAVYFAFAVGLWSLGLAVIGAAISIAYSAKPFRLAYRGLGEVAMMLGYGPIVTGWSYYIHTGNLTPEVLLIGLIPGLSMWTMIIINEIPDYAEDREAGKRNLTYRLGQRKAKNLFVVSLGALYGYVAVLIITGVLPVAAMLVFLGLPLAIAAARAAQSYYLDPIKVAVSNKYMVMVYSVTNLSVALGLLLK